MLSREDFEAFHADDGSIHCYPDDDEPVRFRRYAINATHGDPDYCHNCGRLLDYRRA